MPRTQSLRSRRDVLTAIAAGAVVGVLAPADVLASATDGKLRIGMIGSGRLGSALGRVWAKAGHEVMFSSRHLDRDEALAAEIGAHARAGTMREAATFGAVCVLGVPYRALPEVARALAGSLAGRIVIDACNPFSERDGEIAHRARERGAGLFAADLLPGARIVRAFNLVMAARMGRAHEEPQRFGMPYAGDDEEANAIAARLIRDIGYEPVLIGSLERDGRHLMPYSSLSGEHTPEEVRRIAASL